MNVSTIIVNMRPTEHFTINGYERSCSDVEPSKRVRADILLDEYQLTEKTSGGCRSDPCTEDDVLLIPVRCQW